MSFKRRRHRRVIKNLRKVIRKCDSRSTNVQKAFSIESLLADQTHLVDSTDDIHVEHFLPDTVKKSIGNLRSFSKIQPLLVASGQSVSFQGTTPIQRATIPLILQQRSVLGVAPTGSGKTLAYLVPSIINVMKTAAKDSRNVCLILLPSRILTLQVAKVLDGLLSQSERLKQQTISVIGGTSVIRSADPFVAFAENIRQGHMSFILGTPGKIFALTQKKSPYRDTVREALAKYLSVLVLDEVDRLFDMGCTHQFIELVGMCAEEAQRLYFTATMFPSIENELLTPSFKRRGVKCRVNSALQPSLSLEHEFLLAKSKNHKSGLLHTAIRERIDASREVRKVIVFCNSILETETCFRELCQNPHTRGMTCMLHSKIENSSRVRVIQDLHTNQNIRILVATDIASRGIDIESIDLVVNYCFPTSLVDYIHRSGRTGRAGRTGVVLSFLAQADYEYVPNICQMLDAQGSDVPPDLQYIANSLTRRATPKNSRR